MRLWACILPKIKEIIAKRKELAEVYKICLDYDVELPSIRYGTTYNYAYYPIIFPSEKILLKVQRSLNQAQIFPRRYFYPALNTIPYIKAINKQTMPVAEDIAKRILCLPLYYDIEISTVQKITSIINASL